MGKEHMNTNTSISPSLPLNVRIDWPDGQARVRDLDLGAFLGYARPRDIRKLIERELSSKNLNDSDVRATVARTVKGSIEQEVTEYWLTESAALFVSARSDLPRGAQVLNGLIAFFQQARNSAGRVSKILELAFQNEPREVKPMFSRLIRALIEMRGEQDGPSNPPWARGLAQMVYRWAFGDESQKLRRKLNPSPNGSSVDYGFCTDPGLATLERVIQAGEDYASISGRWDEWRAHMDHRFGGAPQQLYFTAPIRLLPGGKK